MIFDNGDVGATGIDVGDIGHSLRFRASASPSLSRAVVSGSPDTKKWAVHYAIKRGKLGSIQVLDSAQISAGSSAESFYFNASDQLQWSDGAAGISRTSSMVFRDIAGFYFITINYDSANATDADRIRVEVNGTQISFTGSSIPLNRNSYFTTTATNPLAFGTFAGIGGSYLDGYVARRCFVDGVNRSASSFISFNSEINEWVSKSQSSVKAVVDAGGANSFMLDFDNGTSLTTLGYDKSSKGNHWTLNGFSLTAGRTYDWMLDVPGNSYCALSHAKSSSAGLADANLAASANANSYHAVLGTMAPESTKIYFEMELTASVAAPDIGWHKADYAYSDLYNFDSTVRPGSYCIATGGTGSGVYAYNNGSRVQISTGSWATNDILGCAYDPNTKRLWFHRNGVWYPASLGGPAGDPANGLNPTITHSHTGQLLPRTSVYQGYNVQVNFGQRPFAYPPPAGFKALCQANLPEPAITLPKKHFDVLLHAANGNTTQDITGTLFQPDIVWAKCRNDTYNHVLVDSVRGVNKVLSPNLTNIETTNDTVAAFLTNGFTAAGTDNDNFSLNCISGSTRLYVDWLWKAGGSSPVANTQGNIASQVSVNAEAGISIITYRGIGGNTNNSIGHGLGATPEMYFTVPRTGTNYGWPVWHKDLPQSGNSTNGGPYMLTLNTTNNAQAGIGGICAQPTSAVLYPAVVAYDNVSGTDYLCIAFAGKTGFSKFGSYVGTASADNGVQVYCGFKPRWILVHNISVAGQWRIIDTTRSPYNVSVISLRANANNAEDTTGCTVDILSNGFRIRGLGTDTNDSGNVYVYAAFADVPFKYASAR